MAVNDGIAFWNALKVKVKSLIKQDTFNCLRMERYDVTTAPNGTTIGVTMPEGGKEINIPYSKDVANATIGDTVMVGWRGSMSTARAMWFGKGYSGGVSPLDIYPIGSIYMSVNSTNPSTLFGGSWTRLQDTFLLAAGSSYAAGSTGGEATHTLSTTEIPAHTHGSKLGTAYIRLHGYGAGGNFIHNFDNSASGIITGDGYQSGFRSASQLAQQTGAGSYSGFSLSLGHTHNSVGSDGSHNNMPPYLAVYMWKRTA